MKIRFIFRGIILATISIGFGYHLFYGKNGIKEYQQLNQDFMLIKKEYDQATTKLALIEQEIRLWETEPFMKEKVAREDLLYSYTNEYIYLVPQATT